MRDIGINIRTIRIQRGITQEELAQRLFLTRQAISSYETGRTRPDIDMLLKIAEILNTDTNTLLYGPQPTKESKKAKLELIFCAAVALLFGLTYVSLNHYLITYVGHRIVLSIPQNLFKITLLPCMWFLVGWALMHGLLMFTGMPKIQFHNQRKVYIAVWTILCILILIQLPYIIFLATAFYQSMTRTSVTMVFPNVPVYTKLANRMLILTLQANSAYVIWGAIIRLLRPNRHQ